MAIEHSLTTASRLQLQFSTRPSNLDIDVSDFQNYSGFIVDRELENPLLPYVRERLHTTMVDRYRRLSSIRRGTKRASVRLLTSHLDTSEGTMFCHECKNKWWRRRDRDFTCPMCGGNFVEHVEALETVADDPAYPILPAPPTMMKEAKTFTCPICYQSLPVELTTRREDWR